MVQRDKTHRMDRGRFWPGISLPGLFKRRNFIKRSRFKINTIYLVLMIPILAAQIHAQDKKQTENVDNYLQQLDYEGQEAFYEKRYQLAADNWEKCSQFYEARKDSVNLARIDSKRGKVYYRIGNFQKTFQAFNRARAVYSKLKMGPELINIIKEIARSYFGISDYFPAIRSYQEALEIAYQNNWIDDIISIHAGIGQTYYMLGQYSQAKKIYYQTIPISQANDQKWWHARIITYLGVLNFYDFHLDSAGIFFNQAIQIQKVINDERGLKDNYLNLGIIAYNQNDLKTAESFFLKSLNLQQKLEDKNGEIVVNLRLGEVNYQRFEFEQARYNFTAAIDLAKEIGDRVLQATSLNKLSYLEYSQGAYEHAMKVLVEAQDIASRINDPNLLWRINYSMGLVARKELRFSQAFQYYRYAINSIEMTEPEKSFMIQPSEFTKSEIDVFNDAIQTATILAKNYPQQDWLSVLFKTSERLHARKLFYSLLNLDIQIADSLLDEKIREIRTSNQQLRAIQKLLLEEKRTDLFNQNVSRVVSLMAYQETIQMKLQSLRGELNLLYPNFKNLFTYPTTSFEEIQRSLTPGQALLKYIPLEETLVILQLQADTARFYEVNVSNKELKELNRKFYETVFSIHKNPISPALMDQNLKELNTVLRKLSERLIAPVKLNNCNELIILSAPALAGFPFETLYGDIEKQQYLIEKMPIRYISVGQVIQRSYTHDPTQPLEFTLIDGANNSSKQKMMETNRIDFKEIHINPSNARQSTQLSQLKNRAGIFHLVSGGEWFAPDISNSFLKFNFDQNTENLTQAQWFKLQFDKKSLLLFSNMLIIPEFDNLNYFLFYDVLKMMGSQNFLISHWPIPPEITPRLISQLTDKLKSGIDLTQALQSAKKDIISKKDFRHPYYWAGFQYYQ